eukprot:SAG11_NODE_20156_length_451_cov_2.051136_1_plen_59_part_10
MCVPVGGLEPSAEPVFTILTSITLVIMFLKAGAGFQQRHDGVNNRDEFVFHWVTQLRSV